MTQGGWFEFNTIYSIGGEEGEAGGSAPFTSTNHIAR